MPSSWAEARTTGRRTFQAVYRQTDGKLIEVDWDRLPVEAVADGLPVREFRWYQGRRHYSGWYYAATTGRLVAYESRLELARILLADFDRTVAGIAVQPFQLVGPDDGRVRRHVPDLFLVHRDGLVTVVDVKAPSRMKDSKVIAQFEWTRDLCAHRGWAYETWSGAEAPVVENVRFLAGYRRPHLLVEPVVSAVRQAAGQQATIAAVETALAVRFPTEAVRPVVLHLLWCGELVADLRTPLSGATGIRVAS